MESQLPNDFITGSSLLSLSGATTAVWLITGVLGSFIDDASTSRMVKKWLALGLSLFFSFTAVTAQTFSSPMLMWIIIVINGCQIYAAAVGVNTVLATGTNINTFSLLSRSEEKKQKKTKKQSRFFDRWW